MEQSSMEHNKTLPLPLQDFKDAVSLFNRSYRTTAATNIPKLPISIEFDRLLETLFTTNAGTTAEGLVFHFGMNEDGTQIYYILSAGSQNSAGKVSYRAFTGTELGQTNAGYLLMMASNSKKYQIIPESDLCKYKSYYKKHVERKDDSGNWVSIKNDNDHAHLVYHQGTELDTFYENYKSTSQLFLYLHNGSDDPNEVDRKNHLPILRFGLSTEEFKISNKPIFTGMNRYHERALDAGHLCPPFCNSSQVQCP